MKDEINAVKVILSFMWRTYALIAIVYMAWFTGTPIFWEWFP